MPRRKQHVQDMEKYGAKVPPLITKITLGPMYSEWETQRGAGGFGPTCQQQWIKHLLEVHSLACNGQGCARMYEGTDDNTQESNQTKVMQGSRPRGRSKGSTSPRSSSPRNPSSPGRSRGRPRKASSPHRNTSMYVESIMDQEDYVNGDEDEGDVDGSNHGNVMEETTKANGENGHNEQEHEEKTDRVSSSDAIEIGGLSYDLDAITGLEDIGATNTSNSLLDSLRASNTALDSVVADQADETVTFEQVQDVKEEIEEVKVKEEIKSVQESESLEQTSNSRLHELFPKATTTTTSMITQQLKPRQPVPYDNNMPIDFTTRMVPGYPFPNIHMPPSSPSTTATTTSSSSPKSTLPPTAEYKEVRLRRGNGYYIREYIYIKNRDCNGKIFLRCQFRASCRARAVVLVDTGRVIVTQGRHTHPPPHPSMIRFGPHIKDISATWANRGPKKEREQNKNSLKHHLNSSFIDHKGNKIVLQRKKDKTHSSKMVNQLVKQASIPRASSVLTVPTTVPVAGYKFAQQFTGNNITAGNNIINLQQPVIDNGSITKGNSGMPLIVKSWSLLKSMPQNTASIITQPINMLAGGKTCLLLQPNQVNSTTPGLINVVSQPQVSLAYNFNPGTILSQPITTFAQNNLMQRVVVNPANAATNLGLKDNQFILSSPGIATGDALNTITVQPQPTSPLPVQLTTAITPENGIQQFVENGGCDTIMVQPEPTSPLPVQLTAAESLAPENGILQEQADQFMGEDNGSLDLRVASSSPKPPEPTGKKRANISSITEKLMIMKQKQQKF